MDEIARLADPDALGKAALEGGSVDVIVSVPVESFPAAYHVLHPIIDDGSPDMEAWLVEEGRSEHELRLLCALLCTVSDNLPMGTGHHLRWQELVGLDQNLDEFAARRLKQTHRGGIFKFLSDDDLAEATARSRSWRAENA